MSTVIHHMCLMAIRIFLKRKRMSLWTGQFVIMPRKLPWIWKCCNCSAPCIVLCNFWVCTFVLSFLSWLLLRNGMKYPGWSWVMLLKSYYVLHQPSQFFFKGGVNFPMWCCCNISIILGFSVNLVILITCIASIHKGSHSSCHAFGWMFHACG